MAKEMIPLIRHLNWVDIFFLILLIRITYMGIKKGLIIELFKILGVILGIFLSLHYYTRLGDFIFAKTSLPLDFSDFISFLVLVITGYFFFFMLRITVLHLLKVEPINFFNRWGGALVGFLRAILTLSLLISSFYLSTIEYFEKSAKKSFSSSYLTEISPKTYKFLFENLFVKFSPDEKLNERIFEVLP